MERLPPFFLFVHRVPAMLRMETVARGDSMFHASRTSDTSLEGETLAVLFAALREDSRQLVSAFSMVLCVLFPRTPRSCDATYGRETLAFFLLQGETIAMFFFP